MTKKLLILILATFLLSGCTLLPSKEPAATDINSSPIPSASPIPPEIDYLYIESQATSSNNDLDSLEKDLNTTLIPDEDLSDILGE